MRGTHLCPLPYSCTFHSQHPRPEVGLPTLLSSWACISSVREGSFVPAPARPSLRMVYLSHSVAGDSLVSPRAWHQKLSMFSPALTWT